MAGSPLNRLSWLRTSHSFINAIISSSAARWILFNGGQPLIATDSSTQKRTVALLPTDVVRPLLGSEPYFGQGQHEGEACSAKTSTLESARLHGPRIVFLGLDEMDSDINGALPSSDFSNTQAAIANLHGTPFLTVDVADLGPSLINEVIRALQSDSSDRTLAFMEPRAAMTSLDMFTAAVFAEARSMVDWNERNKVVMAMFLVVVTHSRDDIVLPRLWLALVFALGWLETLVYFSFTVGRQPGKKSLPI